LTARELMFGTLPWGEGLPGKLVEGLAAEGVSVPQFLKMMSFLYILDVAAVGNGKLTPAHLANALYLQDESNLKSLQDRWALVRAAGLFIASMTETLDLTKPISLENLPKLYADLYGQDAGFRDFMGRTEFYRLVMPSRQLTLSGHQDNVVKWLYVLYRLQKILGSRYLAMGSDLPEYVTFLDSVLQAHSLEDIQDSEFRLERDRLTLSKGSGVRPYLIVPIEKESGARAIVHIEEAERLLRGVARHGESGARGGERLELRAVVQDTLAVLAEGSFSESRGTAFAAETADALADQARREFDGVAQAVRSEAQNPLYIWKQTGQDVRGSVIHAWDEAATAVFVQNKVDETFEFYNRFLSHHPSEKLNFAFGFPLNETAGESERIKEWMLSYISMIQKLEREYGSRVRGNIRIFVTPREFDNFAHAEFFKTIQSSSSGIAKIVVLDPGTIALDLEKFLRENKNALVYGIQRYDVKAEYLKRFVDLGPVRPVSALPVAIVLSSMLASLSTMITAELLRKLPEVVDGVVRYNGTTLEITSAALDWIYSKQQISEYISQMA
jgi:hypothetical protein